MEFFFGWRCDVRERAESFERLFKTNRANRVADPRYEVTFYVAAGGSDITNQSVLNGPLKGMGPQDSIGSHNGSHRSLCLSSTRCAIETEVPTTNGASFLCPCLSCWGLRDGCTLSTARSLRSPTLVLVVHCPAGLICVPVSAHLADLMTL